MIQEPYQEATEIIHSPLGTHGVTTGDISRCMQLLPQIFRLHSRLHKQRNDAQYLAGECGGLGWLMFSMRMLPL